MAFCRGHGERREGADQTVARIYVLVLLPCPGQALFFVRAQKARPWPVAMVLGVAWDEGFVHGADLQWNLVLNRNHIDRTALVKLVLNRYQIGMSSRILPTEHLEQLAEMLVHVGRSARSEGREDMLTAAQWTALRFFARANRASRTPSAFASFQATTRGTASQVIKSLEQGGFLERHASDTDKRSVRFEVTGQGRDILERDPLRHLVACLARALPEVASGLARRRGDRGFGTCGDCRYFEDRDGAAYCACVASDLAPFEIGQLCANFSTTPTETEPTGSKP